MRKISLFFICMIFTLPGFAQRGGISIDSIVSLMSIEEKVGQMTQVDLGVIAKGENCKLQTPQELDLSKLNLAITKYKIGSVLNVGCGSGTISLENWRKSIGSIQNENAI